ncbi:hypothetical protein AN958_09961 [Leucoagaricus sp. SymC.cos]|nr:hypothetical protein AN958_09961 [Leucoagaricus sp. SymC.cos]
MALRLTYHPDFWIRGGDLYFRVEQTLFRVHSYFFTEESKYWEDELVGPAPRGNEVLKKGKDKKDPIVLKDEKPEEFAQFLWVFYNETFGDYSTATQDTWKVVIHFAGKWGFTEVMKLSLEHLQQDKTMGLVEQIQLYQENKVPKEYIYPLYVKLASRDELVGIEDACALGLETYVAVQQARELWGQAPGKPPYKSRIREGLGKQDIDSIVASTFNL